MNRKELFRYHKQLCDSGLKIMVGKNKDYSAESGPFGNFMVSESFGVPAELGIIIRITDKLKRIESFIRAGTLLVKDESVKDTAVDVINYIVLLMGIIEERKQNAKEENKGGEETKES